MSNPIIHLLAAAENDTSKVIVGIIFFVIWIIGSITSSLKKKQQNEETDLARETEEWERTLPKEPPPPLPAPVVLRRIEPPVRKQPKPKIAKPPRLKTPIPATLPKAASTPPLPTASPALPAIVSPSRASNSARAASVRAWLRPATLRQQFILTELFQPPLALRETPRLPDK